MKEAEVRVLLDKQGLAMQDFLDWMVGQTIGLDENKKPIYWVHDVQQFIHWKKSGIAPKDFD